MVEQRERTSSGEVAATVANASVGLGILTMTFLPLSLGGLLLFVIAPVALILLFAALLALPFVLLFWLVRGVVS